MGARQIIGSVIWGVFTIVLIAVIMMYAYRYALVAYDYGYRIFGETAIDDEPGREVHITVKSDYDVKDIANLLEQKGLIRDAKLFVIQEKLSGLDNGLAPGEYTLTTAMTIEEIISVMAAPDGTEEEDS